MLEQLTDRGRPAPNKTERDLRRSHHGPFDVRSARAVAEAMDLGATHPARLSARLQFSRNNPLAMMTWSAGASLLLAMLAVYHFQRR